MNHWTTVGLLVLNALALVLERNQDLRILPDFASREVKKMLGEAKCKSIFPVAHQWSRMFQNRRCHTFPRCMVAWRST